MASSTMASLGADSFYLLGFDSFLVCGTSVHLQTRSWFLLVGMNHGM